MGPRRAPLKSGALCSGTLCTPLRPTLRTVSSAFLGRLVRTLPLLIAAKRFDLTSVRTVLIMLQPDVRFIAVTDPHGSWSQNIQVHGLFRISARRLFCTSERILRFRFKL